VARNFWRPIRLPPNADKTNKPNTKQPPAFGAAGFIVSKLQLLIIILQAAPADYWFRVCLFSRDDVFQWSVRLSWIGQRQIVRCRDATRVCQCRFQVGAIPRAEIAQFQGAIRCRFRLASFCLAGSPFRDRGREYLVPSYLLELHAVLPQLYRAALVRLSHQAKPLLEVRHYRLAAHLRPLSPSRQSLLQRQSL
jgi:hypothetical protein